MAHFALVDDDGLVEKVIALDNRHAPDPAPENSEPVGRDFIKSLSEIDDSFIGNWIQTSYNGTFRKRYAGIGYRYDADADVFIAPQPYPSWTLDSNYDWQPPTPIPIEGGPWIWNEETTSWEELVTGDK